MHKSQKFKMGSLESSNESSRTLNTPLPTQIKLNPSNNVFIFKEPSPLPENFGMPLIILPNSNSQAPWRHIASDILRSIHSEYSFAKKTDFSFKKKPNLSQNTPILTDISSPKTINETDKSNFK